MAGKLALSMHEFWAIWLGVGVVLTAAGAGLGALEAVLGQTPRHRLDQWPPSPQPTRQAAQFAHPRDCLFTFLALGAGLARAAGWFALWGAAVLLSRAGGGPLALCGLLLLGPALLLGLVPAVIAGRRPRAGERPLLRAGAVVWRLFGPFFDHVQPILAAVARRLFPWSLAERSEPGAEEAATLVRIRAEEGKFLLAEAEVLAEVLRLSRSTVRTYMTPRVDVLAVGDRMSNEEVRALLRRRQFLRAPVIGDTPDEVLGLLDSRILGRLPDGMHFTEALLPPSFVPETMEAARLLSNFLKHRQPLAVVLDEFGGVEGVVTLHDFLEELLADAAPRVDSDLYIVELGDGRLLAAGTARLEDLSEYLGIDATREGIETIGGYVVNELGKLPRQGMTLRLGPWKITVRAISQRRVREVALQRVQPVTGEEGEP